MKEYEIISDYPYLCGETPMWDSVNKKVLWSDMLAGFIFQYDPKDRSIKKIAEGKNVSGFTMNKKGGLVCACHQGLFLWDEKNKYSLITDTFEGDFIRSNDATADAKGRFIFGTTFYVEQADSNYKKGKLYSVSSTGQITILDDGIHLSNGIGFSPDNKIMYYTDTILRIIYKYDYDLNKGFVSNRRVFVKIPDSEGIPDGLTVDSEGFVWSAQWYGSCVARYDPDGKIERYLKVPAKQTSSIVFGGEELTDIYVTTAAKSVRLLAAPKGYDFDGQDIGGPVYRYNLGIKGIAENFADVSI